MKRSVYIAASAFLILSFIPAAAWSGVDPIPKKTFHSNLIKVCIKDISDVSGNKKLSPADFKDALKQAFITRKSIAFIVVDKPEESDVQISARVKRLQYMDRGPLKPSVSPGTVMLDAMATMDSNYADMDVQFFVVDTKSGKEIWNANIYAYLKKKMTEAESIPIIFDKIARKFVAKSFGK